MAQNTDLLYAFTGLSSAQITAVLNTALNKRSELQTSLVEKLTGYPVESLTGFLFSAAMAFYLAERGVNPKIQTFVDALYYISTCLSVGYADIFAQTQSGKLIATLSMAIGPALTGNVFEVPNQAELTSAHTQEMILERLDTILAELKRRQAAED